MHSVIERERRWDWRSDVPEEPIELLGTAPVPLAGRGHIVNEAACEGLWFRIVARARENRPAEAGLATCGEE